MQHESTASPITTTVYQVGLVSLGILRVLQQQSSKLFSELVKEGKRVEARSTATQAHHAKANSLAETVVATKAAYQKQVEAQLQDWDAQLNQLIANAKKAKAEARIKVEDELARLKTQRVAMQQKLDALRHSGEEAWGNLKDSVDKAWGDMSDALGKMVAHFK